MFIKTVGACQKIVPFKIKLYKKGPVPPKISGKEPNKNPNLAEEFFLKVLTIKIPERPCQKISIVGLPGVEPGLLPPQGSGLPLSYSPQYIKIITYPQVCLLYFLMYDII